MSQTTLKRNERWPLVQVGDVADLLRGVSYGKEDASYEPLPTHVPVLRATNIQDAQLVLDSDMVYIAKHNVSDVQRLRVGDIVLATSSGSKHLVGKSALLRHAWGGSFGAFCAALRPKASIDARYLAAYLQSPAYWREIRKKALGVNINNLRRADLEALIFQLPPRDEQETIVAEIEKQFARLDEAVANLKRVKANLKRYKAAVLKAAVEGSLVPCEAELARKGGRVYETGGELLRRILDTRRKKWSGKGEYKEAIPPNASELPALPADWAWANVGQIGLVVSGLTKNPTRDALSMKLPYLRVANVYANELRLDEITEIGVSENELEKLLLFKDDLLIVEGNGSPDQIGRVALWDGSINPCVHQNHLIKVRIDIAEPRFVLNWLLSPHGRNQIERATSSTSGLHTLSTGKIARLTLPLPPLAEQRRIVEEIERRLSLIRGVETQTDANLKRAERMRQSFLHTAFSASLDARQY